MPTTYRHDPSSAYVRTGTLMSDLGTAGTDAGTSVVVAPFNCFVSWIGIVSDTALDVLTTFTLVHSADAGYGTRATPTVLSIDIGAATAHAELSPGMANNYFQAGEPIVISSGGESVAGASCAFTLVLSPA